MAVLAEGMKAPEFDLPRDGGETVTLSEFSGRKLVLFFYPKDGTPICTQQACAFRDAYEDFCDAGAVVIGVSNQMPGRPNDARESPTAEDLVIGTAVIGLPPMSDHQETKARGIQARPASSASQAKFGSHAQVPRATSL